MVRLGGDKINVIIHRFIHTLFLIVIILRLLPRLVSWYLIKKYKVHIQFGRISFPFSLRDVQIRKSGYAVVSVQPPHLFGYCA